MSASSFETSSCQFGALGNFEPAAPSCRKRSPVPLPRVSKALDCRLKRDFRGIPAVPTVRHKLTTVHAVIVDEEAGNLIQGLGGEVVNVARLRIVDGCHGRGNQSVVPNQVSCLVLACTKNAQKANSNQAAAERRNVSDN